MDHSQLAPSPPTKHCVRLVAADADVDTATATGARRRRCTDLFDVDTSRLIIIISAADAVAFAQSYGSGSDWIDWSLVVRSLPDKVGIYVAAGISAKRVPGWLRSWDVQTTAAVVLWSAGGCQLVG